MPVLRVGRAGDPAELPTDPDLRYVWRHLPLTDVHPQAQLAAEAAEAAGAQGAFWPMHDLLLTHQDQLTGADLMRVRARAGAGRGPLPRRPRAARVRRPHRPGRRDADLSGVSGTPTFFVNGQRYTGNFSVGELAEAVRSARTRAELGGRVQDQADVRVRTRSRRGFL